MSTVHKVFVSYQHTHPDQYYRDRFEKIAEDNSIMINHSVQIGDIEGNLPADTIRRIIRDDYLRESTVTVVLIGPTTWQRKHVDWEIGSSIRQTQYSSRSGLLGILLPNYPLNGNHYNSFTILPRLYYNINCGFAKIYKWSDNHNEVSEWIHDAFQNRFKTPPDNSYPNFVNNRAGERWY